MNKSDIIDAVAESAGLSKKSATVAVDTLLDSIVNCLTTGETVALAGFGTFERTYREARTGYNPQTKQPMQIPGSYSVRFKIAKRVKEAVNQGDTVDA